MRLRTAALAATAIAAPAASADTPAQTVGDAIKVHRRCSRTFTARMFDRAARAVYAGSGLPHRGAYGHLWLYARCARWPFSEHRARLIWHRQLVAWAARREAAANASSMSSAVASWYVAAGGPIACGGDSYALGVANRTLPCGTRVLICFQRCVDSIVFDRGPYVWPREFDLSQAVANAVGFSGVATIRYRIGG